MPLQRTTTYDDYERLAENLNNHDNSIVDEESFNIAYTRYLGGTDAIGNEKLRRETYHLLIEKKGLPRENLFRKAHGKDLQRDRQQTSQVIAKNRQEYIIRGASNSDLKGYDDKIFNIMATSKERIIFARETRNKQGRVILRDKKGRIAKRKQ